MGTLTLNSLSNIGIAPNTYTGKTSIVAGTLQLGAKAYLSNAGVAGVLGMPTGADATIDLYNNTTLQLGSTGPRLNQITDRTINLAGNGPGTVNIRVNDNDTLFRFSGVTATGTGPKTLALFTASPAGNGDREVLTFTGVIPDVSDGSPLSLQVTSNQGDTNFVNLPAVNTFTGPITVSTVNTRTTLYLTIGGVREDNGRNYNGTTGQSIAGSGQLGSGNYAGEIALGSKTILNYFSSADQILAGVVSGDGALTKDGSGILTLTGSNTYAGATTVTSGKLLVNGTNSGAGALTVSAAGTLGGTGIIGGNATIAANGKLTFNLSTLAGSHDKLDVTGALAFSGASVLDITNSGVTAAGLYTLATAAGGITGDAPATVNLPVDWAATVSIVGNDLLLDVTSTGSASDYDTWAGPSGFNISGGPDDDDDGDGMTNHQEYAFGLDPTSGSSVNPISGQLNKTTGLFSYTRRATPATTGLTYTYEWSATLGNDWAAFTPDVDPPVSNNATPVEVITVDVPDALLVHPALFLRVKVN